MLTYDGLVNLEGNSMTMAFERSLSSISIYGGFASSARNLISQFITFHD